MTESPAGITSVLQPAHYPLQWDQGGGRSGRCCNYQRADSAAPWAFGILQIGRLPFLRAHHKVERLLHLPPAISFLSNPAGHLLLRSSLKGRQPLTGTETLEFCSCADLLLRVLNERGRTALKPTRHFAASVRSVPCLCWELAFRSTLQQRGQWSTQAGGLNGCIKLGPFV